MAPKLPQQWETKATGERRDRECVTVGLEEGPAERQHHRSEAVCVNGAFIRRVQSSASQYLEDLNIESFMLQAFQIWELI